MASKFHIDRLKGLPDVIRTYYWDVLIPGINRVSNNATMDDLMLRARSVSIPERGVEKIVSNYKGMKQYFPGQINFGGTLPITFEETQDYKVSTILYDWANRIFDVRNASATGGVAQADDKQLIVLPIYIQQYGVDGSPLGKSIRVYNAFIENQDAIQLEYATNDSVKISVTFSFDWWEYGDPI